MGFGAAYGAFGIIHSIIFILVICIFIAAIVRGIKTWNENNNSPRLTVEVRIVSKRTDVTFQNQANAGDITGAHGYSTSTTTQHFVTFQVESGDRMEFSVDGSEYGRCAEGDTGKLSFQGTRFLSFERN